jgi:NAD(P)-dependent dehydrogenase (short-subunit alcohol dehydrogenase family)
MTEQQLRFDGKVVIVTGAGNVPSLGRAYAQLFAQRGAQVVVNDLGVGADGRGVKRANAVAVAEEICKDGGVAIADTHSVAERDSAEAIVQTAIDAFGTVDVLVNNAGVVNHAPFDVLSDADVQRMVNVHLMGTIWMARAVWPYMKEKGYGRIVNTASGTLFGMPHVSIYGAAKGGVFGLTRNLAVEGQPYDIKVNTLSPAAGGASAMTFNPSETEWTKLMNEQQPPALVAPLVALLSHERCPSTGKFLDSGGGRVREVFFGKTQGYENRSMTPEDLLTNWGQVTDRSNPTWYLDAIPYEIPPWTTAPYVPS